MSKWHSHHLTKNWLRAALPQLDYMVNFICALESLFKSAVFFLLLLQSTFPTCITWFRCGSLLAESCNRSLTYLNSEPHAQRLCDLMLDMIDHYREHCRKCRQLWTRTQRSWTTRTISSRQWTCALTYLKQIKFSFFNISVRICSAFSLSHYPVKCYF